MVFMVYLITRALGWLLGMDREEYTNRKLAPSSRGVE